MFHLFDWLITPVLWRTRYLNTCELTSGNKRSPFSPGWSILIKAVGIFCCHLLIIWFLFLLFDVFYCINNIVRVNVSRYKFLYRFEFFWKKDSFFENVSFAWSTIDWIRAVFHFNKMKGSLLIYCPVWVFLRKNC